jgi:hypothetical protein
MQRMVIKLSVKEFIQEKPTYQKYNLYTDWSVGSNPELSEMCIVQVSARKPVIPPFKILYSS